MDVPHRARALGQCSLLRDLPDRDLLRLAASAQLRRYRRGQILFVEGDPGDSLFLLLDGHLKAHSATERGEDFLLAHFRPGDTVGELSVVDGGARTATVTALNDARVLRIPRTVVMAVAEDSVEVMGAFLRAVSAALRRINGVAADLAFLDLPRRVAKFLLAEGAAARGAVICGHLTQAELAAHVGASRQSLNAAIKQFERRGWVRLRGRDIHLVDAAQLERFVGSSTTP